MAATLCALAVVALFFIRSSVGSIERVRKRLLTGTNDDVNTDDKIPFVLWFDRPPQERYKWKNMVRIIKHYDSHGPVVRFLDDETCTKNIEEAEPELLPHFNAENDCFRKKNVCMIASLYLHGGYYFDKEVEIVNTFVPVDGTAFVAVPSCGGGCFSDIFIASKPGHRILKKSLGSMLKMYIEDDDVSLLGSVTMANAFRDLRSFEQREVLLLEEVNLNVDATLAPYEDLKQLREDASEYKYAVYHASDNSIFLLKPLEGTGDCIGELTQKSSKDNLVNRTEQTVENNLNITISGEGQIGRQRISSMDDVDTDKIPVILWFDGPPEGRNMWTNMVRIIKKYESNGPAVRFLYDENCTKNIEEAEPALLPHFNAENDWSRKKNICMIAALYLHGGYYFDRDVEIVNTFIADEGIAFVAVPSCGGDCFSDMFIACVPGHSLLKKSLELMLKMYIEDDDISPLGSVAMSNAFRSFGSSEQEEVLLLEELNLNLDSTPLPYKDLKLVRKDSSDYNYAVYHAKENFIFLLKQFGGTGDRTDEVPQSFLVNQTALTLENKSNIRIEGNDQIGRQRIVILPGPHKTGTSSIQKNIFIWALGNMLGDWVWPTLSELNEENVIFMHKSVKTHVLLHCMFLAGELLGEKWATINIAETFRKKFREEWTKGKSIVFGHESFDMILVPKGNQYYKPRQEEKAIDILLDIMPWSDGHDETPLHGSIDDVEVSVTYRSRRVDHLISVWHQVGWKDQCLSNFLKELPFKSRHWHCDLNPLGLADAFVKKGLSTVLIDMGGLRNEGLDISTVVACEVLNTTLCVDNSVLGPHGKPRVHNRGRNKGCFDLNDDQLDRIDKALTRFDCNYIHLANHPNVRFLHAEYIRNVFYQCENEETLFSLEETVHIIKKISAENNSRQD